MDISVVIGVDTETDIGSFTPFYNGVEKGTPLLTVSYTHLDVYKRQFPRSRLIMACLARRLLFWMWQHES